MTAMVLRTFIVAALLAVSASGAIAAGCSLELQDRWATSTLEMQRLNQVVSRNNNMQMRTEKATLCAAARLAPSLLKTAREYYSACDPIGGIQTVAYLENLVRRTSQFEQANCGK